MKINKFIALAAIAIMAIGAMGFVSSKTYAQSTNPPVSQVQVTQAPDNEPAEVAGKDGQDAAPAGTPAITADAAVKAAQTHLNSTAAGKATLDDENGKLVYSVDLNGSDVKVDAMTGTVLGVDQVGGAEVDFGN